MSSPDARWVFALALLAVAVRLPHLGWGLPRVEEEALPMKKAFAMWGWSHGQIDWNPHTAGWPSLSFYVHLLVQHLDYGWGRLTGAFRDRGDFFVAHWIDPGPLLRVSRGVSVLAAALIVAVGARLALRLAGRGAALLVGALLALAPMLVEHAQLVTPDILAALFAALATDRIVWIATRDHAADDRWAGLWIGLGASSKYTPILLVPGLLIAHGLRSGTGAWRSSRPWQALALAAVAFAATSPFLLLDPSTLSRDVAQQVQHMATGHFGTASQGPSWIGYLTQVLGPGLGWGGFVVAIAGLAWGAARGGPAWRALVACIVPYYLALAVLRTQFPRYVLPLLMPLAIGVAGTMAWVRAASGPVIRRAGLALMTAVVLVPAAIGTWRYHQLQARPSTATLADQFVRDAQRGSALHVAAEVLALSLPTARATAMAAEEARLSPGQQRRMMAQPTYEIDALPMYTVQPEEAARYYDLRHFSAHDLVVITDGVRGRYLADRGRYPEQLRFYDDLDRFAVLAARFRAGDSARGPEVRVYRVPPDMGGRIEHERGVLALPPWNANLHIHVPDYLEFTEGVARAAYAKGRWAMAARYYQAMLEAGRAGWMPEIEQLSLVRLLGMLEERAGNDARAVALDEAFLTRVPGDSVVRAALDRLHVREGRGARSDPR